MAQPPNTKRYSTFENLPFRWFVVVLSITSLLLILLGWLSWQSYREWQTTATKVVRLQKLIGIINTSDEVLTMSARMAAATGDLKWEKRYLNVEPSLDRAIKEAMQILPDKKLSNAISKTDDANITLVEMEKKSFELVHQGQKDGAAELLFSKEYEEQKKIYSNGIIEALAFIDSYIENTLAKQQRRAFMSFISPIAVLLMSLTAWILVLRLTNSYLTQRDRMETELRQSRGFLDSIIENLPLMIFIKDAQNLSFIRFNKAGEDLIGYSRHELLGKNDYDFFPKEEADFFTSKDREVLGKNRNLDIPEEPIQTRLSGERILHTRKIPLLNKEGKPEYLLGISEDITERKKTEKQIERFSHLREELLGLGSLEKKLSCVTDAVVDIFSADFCRIWIIKPGDLCDSGCPHAKVTEGPHACRHRDQCLHLAASSGRYSGLESKMHARVPFGSYKIGMVASGDIPSFNTNDVTNDPRIHDREWAKQLGLVSFTGYRLFSETNLPVGVLALFSKHAIEPNELGLLEGIANSTSQVIQVTISQKEKEAMQAQLLRAHKFEAVGLMAGGVAHDLNNILAGIVSYPELLLLKLPESSELRKPIKDIHEAGKRAASVVDDLLTVARGAAIAREPRDINILIDEYLNSPECKKLNSSYPGVDFSVQLKAEQPVISCSPMHIKKILMNLIINAAEAIKDTGNITISTNNRTVDDFSMAGNGMKSGNYLILTVKDDGPGISSNDLDHIFEPFYTRKVMGHSGTGLGLAIVWNTVMDHNGKIFVNSNTEGTEFQLYFPVSLDNIIPTESDFIAEPASNSEHILVVDDEPLLQNIACKMLESMGYTASSVNSGEMALKFLEENPVDLIVVDMLMEPGMNGRQTYEEILKLYPAQKAIIVSGFSESEDVKAALRLGAFCFIKKPYSMGQFAQAVTSALRA